MSKSKEQLQWVRAENGAIPATGIAEGVERDGRPLFIARAFYKNGLHPGKAAPHLANGGFEFSWGGQACRLSEYFVLTGDINRTKWVPVSGAVPNDDSLRLVNGGHEENGRPLFIAKADHAGSLQLGKAGNHLHNGMSFAYGNKELYKKGYFVLAYR
ncbi:hypothetical protein J3B02_000037 [Coemansia erecta]|uniref:DUF3421 domain-containing protein n=1 Tax=Coemansia asiatica TaxID=1052880 RepID=A0A9W7XQE3_9FUNG|nr:hypothetical protein LPJ64_001558 [Coemansia asiatica]KAJ2858656.1 hypothetical protein J3B02_000037 [Coemansia erecta]